MSSRTPISQKAPMTKKVEDLLRSEVKAAQDVLALQQRDNYRYQDYVRIQDAEIDALRAMLNEKQQIINDQKVQLAMKDDRIKELEQQLYDNRIEKHAFKTFEHQNVLLLDELRETKERMEELEVELRFLRDFKDQKTEYDESKIKMVAEMDVMLNGQNYEYRYS